MDLLSDGNSLKEQTSTVLVHLRNIFLDNFASQRLLISWLEDFYGRAVRKVNREIRDVEVKRSKRRCFLILRRRNCQEKFRIVNVRKTNMILR